MSDAPAATADSEAWDDDLLDGASCRLAEQAARAAGLSLEQWLERAIRRACALHGKAEPPETAAPDAAVDRRPSQRATRRALALLTPPLLVVAGFAYLALRGEQESPALPRAPAVIVALPPAPSAERDQAEEPEPSDPTQLALWLAPRAERGDALAQYRLGAAYASGKGVALDYARAAPLLRAAAESGIAEAQFDYAALCEAGNGVPKDAAAAIEWYRKAAAQNHVGALVTLGYAYANGLGVMRSMPDAARLFRQASELGAVDAQYNLAFLYEHGEGVAKSAIDAYAWYSIAAAGGDQAAQRAAARLARDLPPDQRPDAEARIAELRKSIKGERQER